MLYKESQAVFLETKKSFYLSLHVSKGTDRKLTPPLCFFTVNSIPAFTVECQAGSVMYNELAACVAVTQEVKIERWLLPDSVSSAT